MGHSWCTLACKWEDSVQLTALQHLTTPWIIADRSFATYNTCGLRNRRQEARRGSKVALVRQPLLEMFDQWDDTIQTGNDTEYGLVVLALCVGVAYSFAHFIFKYSLRGFLAKNALTSRVHKAFRSTPCSFVPLLFNPLSPPTLALRI